MKLIFFRHGLAVPKKPKQSGMDDYQRTLVKKGRRETKKFVKTFKSLFTEVDVVFTSPLLRAVETAEIVWTKSKGGFEIMTSLDSLASTQDFIKDLQSLKPNGCYCFVGHEPHLTQVVSRLTGHSSGSLVLDKSGFLVLEGKDSFDLQLTALLSPKIS